jgi:hypothetical protein
MSVSDPRLNKPWAWKTTANLAGAAIGIVGGVYAGFDLLIPGVAGGIAFWILRKTAWIKDRSLLAASAIQAGHAFWMLVGLLAVEAGPINYVEIIGYAVAVALLIWRQEKWLVIVLIAYQGFCVVINILNLLDVPEILRHALVAHLLLRAGAIFYMLSYLLRKPQENLVEVF